MKKSLIYGVEWIMVSDLKHFIIELQERGNTDKGIIKKLMSELSGSKEKGECLK